MQRVGPGQPIRANTINVMMNALESINLLPTSTYSPGAAQQYLYPTLPAFTVTMVNGTAYVSNGAVYVDGQLIKGDTLGSLGGSITDFEDTRTGTSGAVYLAVEYDTNEGTSPVEGVPASSSVEGYARGVARLAWGTPPTKPAESPYGHFYVLKLAEIVENAANRYARIHHRGNVYITSGNRGSGGGEAVPLAQYFSDSAPDTPGKIAGIYRIPADTWMQSGTTNVDGTWTASGSSVEKIVDGVLFLMEPRQYKLANYNNGNTPNNFGLIASVTFTEPRNTARINNGVLHLPSRVEAPAQFVPSTFDGGPSNTTCVEGTIRSITATSSVDGIPRIIDGNIFFPAANADSPTHGTTPGYVHGIIYTTSVEAPRIHEGQIQLPMPDSPSGLSGIQTTSGAFFDWVDMQDGHAYKIGTAVSTGYMAGSQVFPTGTYAIKTSALNGHSTPRNYLSIIIMSGTHDVPDSQLDALIQNHYTLHT